MERLAVGSGEHEAVLVLDACVGELGGLLATPLRELGEGVAVEGDVAATGPGLESGEDQLVVDGVGARRNVRDGRAKLEAAASPDKRSPPGGSDLSAGSSSHPIAETDPAARTGSPAEST